MSKEFLVFPLEADYLIRTIFEEDSLTREPFKTAVKKSLY